MNSLNLFYSLFGQTVYATETTDKILFAINKTFINPAIRVIFTLGFAYFIYGVFMFFVNRDNSTKREEGKQHMLFSIVGLAIMSSVWGIMLLISRSVDATYINEKNVKGGSVHIEYK